MRAIFSKDESLSGCVARQQRSDITEIHSATVVTMIQLTTIQRRGSGDNAWPLELRLRKVHSYAESMELISPRE